MIRTGGGRFDPSEEPIFFLVGEHMELYRAHDYNLIALNELASGDPDAGSKGLEVFEALLAAGNKVLLDSGVFWLTNRHARAHGVSMNEALALPPDEIDGFHWLLHNYLSIVKRYEHDLWGYIELDQGGATYKRETRKMLEQEGLRPIPVYHPLNDGWAYFDEIASTYDRICLGNVVQASVPTRKQLLATAWERRRRYPGLWIHVLGLSPSEMTTVYPQSSFDASSWLYAIRFGAGAPNGATSMSDRFGPFDSVFSYDLGDKDSYSKATEWLGAEHRFQHEAMRAHYRDVCDTFETTLWPEADDKEGVRT